MKTKFRYAIAGWMLSYFAFFIMPTFVWPLYDEQTWLLLSYSYYGGMEQNYLNAFAYLYASTSLLSAAGLWFYKRWARTLFIALFIISFAATPLVGILILPPLDNFLIALTGFFQAAILIMSLLTSVASEFKPLMSGTSE